ncbi:MAG TPA: polyphosphate kinase 1 [Thermoanaerobaculia bacterium]|nr:polyphosphate kinase 1 [Thermoanaerobaculia bacterium]
MREHEQRPRRKRPLTLVEAEIPAPLASAPAPAPVATVPLLNRELSWLAFNDRVLDEAFDEGWPLLERLKFLAISATNLDEFFMVRVSGLLDQLSAEVVEPSDDGLTPAEQLALIRQTVQGMAARQTQCLMQDLWPKLAAAGIAVLSFPELPEEKREAASVYFRRNVLPVLTPLAVDPGHPFPFLSNLSLNYAVELRNPETGRTSFARVKIPGALPRLLSMREILEGKKKVKPERAEFLLLESLVQANLGELFPGLDILSSHPFRITRDADIEIQEDEASDLLVTVQQEVRRRRFGAVVRLELAPKTPKRVRKLLMRQLEVGESETYESEGVLGLGDLASLVRLERKDLKDPPFAPAVSSALSRPETTIFEAIRASDVFLHHPYDSFAPVSELIDEAADDPKVLAIKMTLYRTSADSGFVPALVRAAEDGKQVAVLVELKARFDEEKNIVWAKALEQAGVHVVYGVLGLKTHAKIALVVRREKEEIRRYVHLGTGNYNPTTARLYTDFSLLTARREFGEDATRLFNALTGHAPKTTYARLVTAPKDMHRAVLEWIGRERDHARAGRPAGIKAMLNALVDPRVIAALYEASQAGVPVDLVVRGVCCLKPGVPGLSETIRVRSIVGRFLEHSRAFVFENGGQREVWLSSADWMPRNFFRRVELAFPVEDPDIARHVAVDVFGTLLADNVRARVLKPDGTYERLTPAGGEAWDAQAAFLEEARRRLRAVAAERSGAADEFDFVPEPRDRDASGMS